MKAAFTIFITIILAIGGPGICCVKAQETTQDVPTNIRPGSNLQLTGMRNITCSMAMPVGSLTYGIIAKDKNMIRFGLEVACSRLAGIAICASYRRLANRKQGVSYSDFVNQYPGYRHGAACRRTTAAFATATIFAMRYKKWYVAVPAYAYAGTVASTGMMCDKKMTPVNLGVNMAVGTASGLLTHWVSKKIFPAKPKLVATSF